MTRLFHVGPPRPSDFDRSVRYTTWNFWKEIEVLNKEYWIPTIKTEDEEDLVVARGFIRWYIGESDPVRRPILVKYPVSGHSRARIKSWKGPVNLIGMMVSMQKESDLLPKSYRFVWIPLEALWSAVGHLRMRPQMGGAQNVTCLRPILA